LEERKGYLRLKGDKSTIGEIGSPTFVGRRVQDINFSATTTLEFNPQNAKEEAGITLVNNGSHFDLSITKFERERTVQVKLQFGKTVYKSEKVILKPGPVKLRIEGDSNEFTFSYAQGNDDFKRVDSATSTYLSSETVGGFTGLYVGMFSTGNGERSSTNADFDWFNYQPK
jgi:alpha-N-arabinofuranosidase